MTLNIKFPTKTFFFLLTSMVGSSAYSVYRVPEKNDQAYIDAAQPFQGVLKLRVEGANPLDESYGSGTYIEDPATGKRFILTAAHVMHPGKKSWIILGNQEIPLENIHYFPEDLQESYQHQKIALSFINAIRGERLFGGRINHSEILKAISYYGGDLAIAFLPSGVTLPIKPYAIASSYDPQLNQQTWVVGYGISGVIRKVGHYTGTVYGSGRRRAYTPVLETGILIKMMNFETGQEQEHASWMSIIQENTPVPLPGQVGYGDSGGPVMVQNAAGAYEIIGVVTSTLPASQSKLFLETITPWQKFILKLGNNAEKRSYLAYLLSQESNTYGSESLFSGVVSTLAKDWIHQTLKTHHTFESN